MTGTRYAIRRAAWARPLLALFTITAARSWVELADDGLRVRYGWYTTTVPYGLITSGRRTRWPWYAGLGWRTNFRSVLGLIGSYQGVAKITLDPPHRTRLLGIGFGTSELYISLDEPDRFLRDLERRVVPRPEVE
jgi:hypothetical protein